MSREKKFLIFAAACTVAGGVLAHSLPRQPYRLPKEKDPYDNQPLGIGG